jgi:hypothetical protein
MDSAKRLKAKEKWTPLIILLMMLSETKGHQLIEKKIILKPKNQTNEKIGIN